MSESRTMLSRVTPGPVTLSQRGTTVPTNVTSDTAGKLPMRLDVPNRIISDLLLFNASPLWQSQECKQRIACLQSAELNSQVVRGHSGTTGIISLLLQRNPVIQRSTDNR